MADTRVVVVGAGPVGLVTTLGLARAGVDVTLFETAHLTVGASLGHDMVYHWAALPGLQRLGVLDDMTAAGLIGRYWTLMVAATGERIVMDWGQLADRIPFPHTVHLPPDRLAAVVLPHIRRHRHVTVRLGTRVTDVAPDADGVTVTADGPDGPSVTRADWVVGTDGAHSVVRRALGIGFAGTTWPYHIIATTTEFDWSTVGCSELTYRVAPSYPAMAARIDDRQWRFVYIEPRNVAPESVASRMPDAFEAILGPAVDPGLVGWSTYRVHERAAENFRAGRVLLAGDAAHVTNPTMTLGLASGLLDSYVLVEALAAVVHGDRGPGVLDRYAAERRRVFLDTTSVLSSRGMHTVLADDGPLEQEVRLDVYRRAAADPAALFDMFSDCGELETPSVL